MPPQESHPLSRPPICMSTLSSSTLPCNTVQCSGLALEVKWVVRSEVVVGPARLPPTKRSRHLPGTVWATWHTPSQRQYELIGMSHIIIFTTQRGEEQAVSARNIRKENPCWLLRVQVTQGLHAKPGNKRFGHRGKAGEKWRVSTLGPHWLDLNLDCVTAGVLTCLPQFPHQ